ncbi:hypothetical protein TrRE_jg4819 [Triparma retinervis]|uniref:Uncharacterized protein n=1 Tax=Triparma retinervis TaxID=2557542 RepID=A0A9W7F6V4_9STRA|nr:hypothetical protein TrRE_jg4819 [Triparma retinervis]
MNPEGLVPVLIKEDGTVLCESDRIVTFMNPSDDCIFSSYLNTDFLPSTKSAIISSSLLPSIMPTSSSYFSGEEFGNSDIRVLPFIQRIEEEYGIPEECGDLKEWWARNKERESFKQTVVKQWWWWW